MHAGHKRIVPLMMVLALFACGEDRRLLLEPRADLVVSGVSAGSAVPWSTFGDAASIRRQTGADPWAVELRSVAGSFGGVAFHPPTSFTFAQLTLLSADFNVTDDDCGGGSPRFQVGLDTDADGDRDGNIFVALGPTPNFTGCEGGWQSTGNLIGNNDHGRYDASQVGGSAFGTYEAALAAAGDARVVGIQLVVDASWFFADGEQTVLVDNVQVNEHRLKARGFLP